MAFPDDVGRRVVLLYDGEGNPLSFVEDGDAYRLPTQAKLQNATDDIINPATEDTLFESKYLTRAILVELSRIRLLLEILTDEKVDDRDAEIEDGQT